MRAGREHAGRIGQSPISVLERWERHGAIWRVVSRSRDEAIVEFRTCHGELVDELRFSDPGILGYLASRSSSGTDA